jgi:phosphoglycolate phosphatase-like HAD superfamily hydrolase
VVCLINDIIWDFDGTLFDSYPGIVHSFKQALKDMEIDEEDENILKYMKLSVSCAINHFKNLYKLDDELINKYVNYEKNMDPESVIPFPYAIDICKKVVEKGGRNHILTHRGNSTFRFLEHYGMINLFTEVVTKHNGFKRKPDPEGFLYIIEKYNIDKDKALVVGDRECEILGAKESGIKVCLYDTNNIDYEVTPDFCINSLKELEGIIC